MLKIFSDGGIAGDIVEQEAPHFPVDSEELPSAVALLETYTRMPDWLAWELGGEGPHCRGGARVLLAE